MAQYTQKFERWLDSRKMSLSSLRDNPAKERSLWHTFAYARAGASDLTEPAQSNAPVRSPTSQRTHSRSRSRSRSSSRSTRGNSERGRPITPTGGYSRNKPMQRGSVPTAVSLPQRDRSLSPDRRGRSRSPPASLAPPENPHLLINKTRSQLLERRLLELAAFQKEIEQNGANATDGNTLVAIPVPLLPGESMGLYDHRFWTWAKSYSDSIDGIPSVNTDNFSTANFIERRHLIGNSDNKFSGCVATKVNVIEHHSADTEPDTAPAELSEAESNATDDSEEHDGDVMNEDGCCCNKCMRNWAKTLTDRMDQLERNVGDLKREVNSAQTMTASGS
ncbi:hypothetical protein PInf_012341 [Phytophthora infestans]|nr:hypothetical protein PInf_012341 [Phytophthora infestans]